MIGNVVISKAGRDKGRCFAVIGQISSEYLLISDGSTHTVGKPKKKKLAHLEVTELFLHEVETLVKENALTDEKLSEAIRRDCSA